MFADKERLSNHKWWKRAKRKITSNFKVYLGTSTTREQDKIDRKMSLPFRKTGYVDVTKSKEK